MLTISTPGGGQEPCLWHTRRLWSLWDMLELNGSAFLEATVKLAELNIWIAAAGKDEDDVFHENRKLDDDDRRIITSRVTDLTDHLAVLGARITLLTLEDTNQAIDRPSATWGIVRERCSEIVRNLRRELTLVTLLALDPGERELFSGAAPAFGADVDTKLSDAAEDIENASKCLAVGQGTACVFHLMRVMELALAALANKLGVTITEDMDWGAILSALHGKISALPKTTVPEKNLKDAYSEAHTNLYHVKQAWRHPIAHAVKKKTYTPQQAKQVYEAVKVFTSHLASLL